MRSRCALCLVLLATAHAAATANEKEWNPDIFPNPKRDTFLCGRQGRVSSLCDVDSVLSEQVKNRLEGLINDIQQGESPYRQSMCGSGGMEGYEVAVAVMKKMRVRAGEDPATVAREFAKVLHSRWGVGNSECDNGVLVLLSIDDRQVYVSTGEQSQREGLPDATLGRIVSWMVPYLKRGDYGEAMLRGVTNIGLALSGWDVAQDDSSLSVGLVFFFIVLAFMLFSIISSMLSARKRMKRLKNCKSILEKIKNEQEKVISREWSEHRTCPVCFDPFEDEGSGLSTVEEGDGLLSQPTEMKKRLVLKCGHSVCEPCLKTWMERNRTCPICRHDIDDEEGSSRGDGNAVGSTDNRESGLSQVIAADLLYRLRRTQRLYPEFISDDLVRDWGRSGAETGTFRMERFFTNQTIAVSQTNRGIHGSSSVTFGGGHGGGGGAGASW
jgi:uncharacterized membrane protein YgcG